MTERDSFLASILANPADDAVRLIFADWLEERGECARAEFIRVQCELVSLPTPPSPPPSRDVHRVRLHNEDVTFVFDIKDAQGQFAPVDRLDIRFILNPDDGLVRVSPPQTDGSRVKVNVSANGATTHQLYRFSLLGNQDGATLVMASGTLLFEGDCSCGWCRLQRRERKLLLAHQPRWIFDALGDQYRAYVQNPSQPSGWPYWKWSRGFVSEITLPASDWLTHRDTLLRTVPLEQVTLTQARAGRMRREDGSLVCSVYPAERTPCEAIALEARQGQLWYTMNPNGQHDVFEVRVEPDYPASAFPRPNVVSIEDAFREYWNREVERIYAEQNLSGALTHNEARERIRREVLPDISV